MQALDRRAIDEIGIPSLVLMEVAGRAVADATEGLYRRSYGAPILILAGPGNNGADAVVAARHLSERGLAFQLVVLAESEQLSEDHQTQLKIASKLGIDYRMASTAEDCAALATEFSHFGVVIDGIFGTGLSRPIEGYRASLIDALNLSDNPVVAVDMPSGVDADTGQVLGVAVDAELTVSFQFAKVGQLLFPGRQLVGQLKVVDIGIPPSILDTQQLSIGLMGNDTLRQALIPRDPDSHKGTYGHLLVVAGTPDRPGAALLTARSALRAGAGLVTVGSQAATITRLAPALVEVMGLSLGEERLDLDRVMGAMMGATAAAIGPSLAPDEHLRTLLHDILPQARLPVVLDAGALTALGQDHACLKNRSAETVLTPHPGEMGRLMGLDSHAVQENRLESARRLADETGAHVVLKGAATVVASPGGQVAISGRGNPGMATAGAGDVLTGVVGALIAQGVSPGLAARAGVELHSVAGDRASETLGDRALMASDLVRHLAGPLEGVD